ncbi:hypothetical protein F5Y12DRAFT_797799 [Xylaria sp. FL1777]|nr:hypothetical protein F5Y12DRAFT_797799 [Xylaria sp. FL1777]
MSKVSLFCRTSLDFDDWQAAPEFDAGVLQLNSIRQFNTLTDRHPISDLLTLISIFNPVMCLLLGAMCPKTKTKSRTSTKKSSKKHRCHDCTTCEVTKGLGYSQMYVPQIPVPMMNQTQPWYNHGYGYGYPDWAAWEDNYPAMISTKQWREHTQTAQNAYNSVQENGKRIDEVKGTIAGDIKEAQNAIIETHASVNNTESQVRETRDAIDLAQVGIKSTHAAVKEAQLAILKTQDAINDKHAEQLSKQEACAADVARVRQLLEEEAKKREEARRVEEMVRYAQSQGLLQTQPQAQPDRERRGRSSRSSSSTNSTASRDVDEEERKRQQWNREHQRRAAYYAKTMQEATDARLRLLEEQERWSRAEEQLDFLRRRDAHLLHPPRLQDAFYDDLAEAPAYNASSYSYAEHGIGHRGARGQLPRRGQPGITRFRCAAQQDYAG